MQNERLIDASILALIKDTFHDIRKSGSDDYSNENILSVWEKLNNWTALDNILKQAPEVLLGSLAGYTKEQWIDYLTASVRAMKEWYNTIKLPTNS